MSSATLLDITDFNSYSSPSYVERLKNIIGSTSKRRIFQNGAHTTYSQFVVDYSVPFGTPSIRRLSSNPIVLSNWVTKVLELSEKGQEESALKKITLSTMEFKESKEFSKLSSDLESFDLKNLPDVILIALVRNTFSIRSQLSCWNNLIIQIEQILVKRNRNPRSLFRGLKSYS